MVSDKGVYLHKEQWAKIVSADTFKVRRIFNLDDRHLMLVANNKVDVYDVEQSHFIHADIDSSELEMLITTQSVITRSAPIIATHKGLFVVSPGLQEYQLYNMKSSFADGLISETIHDIIKYNDDTYILATEKGIIRFKTDKNDFYPYTNTSHFSVSSLTIVDSVLWLATQQGLISFVLESANIVQHSYMSPHKLSSHLTSFLAQDANGHIWVGTTDRGVNRIDTTDLCVSHFLPGECESDFWGENASSFVQDKFGTIYIGSDAGINVFNADSLSFTHLTIADGLPSNIIKGLTLDDNNLLWIVTDRGLAAYHLYSKQVKIFDEQWGLQCNVLNGNIRCWNKSLILPSEVGFYSFNPELLWSFEQKTSCQLTDVKVFGKPYQSDFQTSGTIHLDYKQNFFTLEFSNFNFSEGGSTYYYKLEGLDPDWVKTSSNTASYTKIDPGIYTFKVMDEMAYRDNKEAFEVRLYITPPYWKRWWFVLIEMLLLFIITYGIYSQRLKQYRLMNSQLELQQKLLRSQMNPHFVFNALIAIQSFIFNNDVKEAGRYLSKFAKLMRLFLQNTRQEELSLDKEIETLDHYLALQKLRFADTFDYEIISDESIDTSSYTLPPMMAQPFVENAIEHGFKGIDYVGKLRVCYKLFDKYMQITITDNGIGIKQTKSQQSHKSLATTITKERLKSKSTKGLKYSLNIRDLGDEDSRRTGTEVVLKVPFNEAFNID